MTNQELFDIVLNHLREQGCQAVGINSGGGLSCKYRVIIEDKMCKCAAGCLITDDDYGADIEGATVDNLEYIFKPLELDIDFLRVLQMIHDDYVATNSSPPFIKYINQKFAELACENHLIYHGEGVY